MNAVKVIGCLGEYYDFGFHVIEDDHTIELWFKDKFIARFSAEGVTKESIRSACREYLKGVNQAPGLWSCR